MSMEHVGAMVKTHVRVGPQINMTHFQSHEVVGRCSEAQLKVGKILILFNLSYLI